MITRREELWLRKYNEMREYILRVHHLPDKKKKENSVLVNWWKYNKKRFKQGLLSEEKAKLLKELYVIIHGNVCIPCVGTVIRDNKIFRNAKLAEIGSETVQSGVKCAVRIYRLQFIVSEKLDHFLLRNVSAAAINHVCKKQPHLI